MPNEMNEKDTPPPAGNGSLEVTPSQEKFAYIIQAVLLVAIVAGGIVYFRQAGSPPPVDQPRSAATEAKPSAQQKLEWKADQRILPEDGTFGAAGIGAGSRPAQVVSLPTPPGKMSGAAGGRMAALVARDKSGRIVTSFVDTESLRATAWSVVTGARGGGGEPAVGAFQGGRRLALATRDPGNTISFSTLELPGKKWGPWKILPGTMPGNPSVAAYGESDAVVLTRGADNAAWLAVLRNGDANGAHWESAEGGIAGDPLGFSIWGGKRFLVFVLGIAARDVHARIRNLATGEWGNYIPIWGNAIGKVSGTYDPTTDLATLASRTGAGATFVWVFCPSLSSAVPVALDGAISSDPITVPYAGGRRVAIFAAGDGGKLKVASVHPLQKVSSPWADTGLTGEPVAAWLHGDHIGLVVQSHDGGSAQAARFKIGDGARGVASPKTGATNQK